MNAPLIHRIIRPRAAGVAAVFAGRRTDRLTAEVIQVVGGGTT
ncbi:hypothetical protein [Nonomuraea sp. NPDC050786]